MIVFLWCIYLLCAFLRLTGWLFFRLQVKIRKPIKASWTGKEADGISVVVCAHNNRVGLQKLMPALLNQQDVLFEVVIVNDRSTDDTASWLTEQQQQFSPLKVVTIDFTPETWNAKKYALSQGIKATRYPLLALTDSDCLPLSDYWLFHIVKQLTLSKKSIFLGYSPYEERSGILNKVIQTETLFTALQYFSMASAGYTYMGVGRNLGYRKSFIEPHLDAFPFQNHLGGDDDLLINQLSTGTDAITSMEPESFVMTYPPLNLKAWWRQKRRHLSAGAQYKPFTRKVLGTYWLSAVLFWLSFFLLLALQSWPENASLLGSHFVFFCIGTVVLLPVFRIFKALRLIPLFLFWDFLYIASSSIIGFSTFLVKNKKWN